MGWQLRKQEQLKDADHGKEGVELSRLFPRPPPPLSLALGNKSGLHFSLFQVLISLFPSIAPCCGRIQRSGCFSAVAVS